MSALRAARDKLLNSGRCPWPTWVPACAAERRVRQLDLRIAVAEIEWPGQRHRRGTEAPLQVLRPLSPMRVAQQRRDGVIGAGRRGRDQRRRVKDRDRPPWVGALAARRRTAAGQARDSRCAEGILSIFRRRRPAHASYNLLIINRKMARWRMMTAIS